MPTLDDVLPNLNGAKLFSLWDAKDGFFQIKLGEQSSYLTTFWGPDGRYRRLRLPFGVSSAKEDFQRRLQGTLLGLKGSLLSLDTSLMLAVVADDIRFMR